MSRMRYFTLNTIVLISWGKCLLVSSLEKLDGGGESCAVDLGGPLLWSFFVPHILVSGLEVSELAVGSPV